MSHETHHSTGPRTDAGKAASSKNATKHGLTAKGLIILPGQEEAFADLQDELRASIRPNTFGLQNILFERALQAAWNLHRCRLAEVQLYENSADITVDPLLDDRNAAKYDRIQKYAKQWESTLHKSLKAIGDLQTDERFRNENHPLSEEEKEDNEKFAQTPQWLSEVLSWIKITAAVRKDTPHSTAVERDTTTLKVLDMICSMGSGRGIGGGIDDTMLRTHTRKSEAAA